ncbi:MAG TPA: hypothetical protein VF723_03150 [Pyrinomonadaceae bacterium]|jgi:hypothetical protein
MTEPKFKPAERSRAIRRGLEFIYAVALEPRHFRDYGRDLLFCFNQISATSADPLVRRMARRMGRERARRYRLDYPSLPRRASPDQLANLVFGSYAADALGVAAPALKKQIAAGAARYTARDYLLFDPRVEPPPGDVPQDCECGMSHERGRKTCRRCRRRLVMWNRYVIWYNALTRTYTGERYGVLLGARYADVLGWLPAMRPFRGREGGANADFYDSVYAVTHVVYTLNDYSLYNLSPGWLPAEYAFLKANLREAIAIEDAEMLGEFLDTLKSFGLKDTHPLMREGMQYVLSRQNEDGSWGDPRAEDIYDRYHPTWTAIGGLCDYDWRGRRLSFPELKPLLRQWTK